MHLRFNSVFSAALRIAGVALPLGALGARLAAQPQSVLTGKALTLKINNGLAPFATSGTQVLTLDTPTAGSYTLDTNGTRTTAGTYTYVAGNSGANLTLNSYFSNGTAATIALYNYNAAAGTGGFETYTTGVAASNNGTYTIGTPGSTGGATTAPAITGSTSLTATVGQAFSYQITTNPAATSFDNMGGNAPIAINPVTGLVTGTFTSAGTFTFSVKANNAAGSSATTQFTVTASAGSSSGGGGTVDTSGKYAGHYVGKIGTRTFSSTSANFADYDVAIAADGSVSVTIAGVSGALTGTVATSGIVTFTGGAAFSTYGISQALVENTYFSSVYGATVIDTRYRFELSTAYLPATGTVVAAPNIGSLAGTYSGQQYFAIGNAAANTLFGDWVASVTPGGVLTAMAGMLTGRVDAQGTVTFDAAGANLAFGYTTGKIENGRLTAIGKVNAGGVVVATYRIDAPLVTGGSVQVPVSTVAPLNLAGYRNRVGQSFQFTVTGAATGAAWGTDVYTDDSAIARAAVHAGVVAVGETKVVTITILPGQGSYTGSTRNGVSTASWGGWAGSYSFAGTTAASTAVTKPALASNAVALAKTLSAGARLVLPINVVGGGTYTYQWYLNGVALAGATANPYVIDSVGAAHAGTYTVDVTNALGTSRLTAGTIGITSVGAPVLALQPISKVVAPGGVFTLAVNASGAGNTYQWYRNGTALTNESGPILLRQNVTAADAGSYAVKVTNSAGSVTSNAGTITLSANASRPANISVRANVASGQSIIPGFVVQGAGSKRVVVRAVGPGLAAVGVGGVMANPKLEIYRGSTKVAENDDWDGTVATKNAFDSVGAFGLSAGSKDAALVTNLTAGQGYTVVVSGVAGSGGVVLVEVYDADAAGTSTSTLVNASVRGQAGTGDATLILGLVIGGEGPRTLLVRGVGPKLQSFGVGSPLADPQLQIFDANSRRVIGNDNWGQADFVGELVQATDYVRAFALDPGSKDAATLALLEPGAYTVHVAGVNGTTGETLVEVYDVP